MYGPIHLWNLGHFLLGVMSIKKDAGVMGYEPETHGVAVGWPLGDLPDTILSLSCPRDSLFSDQSSEPALERFLTLSPWTVSLNWICFQVGLTGLLTWVWEWFSHFRGPEAPGGLIPLHKLGPTPSDLIGGCCWVGTTLWEPLSWILEQSSEMTAYFSILMSIRWVKKATG